MSIKRKNMPKGLTIRSTGDKIVYRLYDTDIVTIDVRLKGFTLNTGGWYTNHTKKCINLALEQFKYSVFQKNKQWYLQNLSDPDREPYRFKDGISIY